MAPKLLGMALHIFQILRLGMGTTVLARHKTDKFIYQGRSTLQLWTKPHMASGSVNRVYGKQLG